MKRYIKPTMKIEDAEIQEILQTSNPDVQTNPGADPINPGTIDTKGFNLYDDEAKSNGLWED